MPIMPMTPLLFAPYPTDLIPVKVAGYDHGEKDSYEQEEHDLLFAAWCAEVDAGEPPF